MDKDILNNGNHFYQSPFSSGKTLLWDETIDEYGEIKKLDVKENDGILQSVWL